MMAAGPAARTRLAELPTPLVGVPRLADGLGTAMAEQAMRTEGLMVDPVDTAKTLALVPGYAGDGTAVFWPTGGQLDTVAVAAEAHR